MIIAETDLFSGRLLVLLNGSLFNHLLASLALFLHQIVK